MVGTRGCGDGVRAASGGGTCSGQLSCGGDVGT